MPSTIKNYLSGAETWVEHHLGDAKAFSAAPPSDVLKRVTASLNHVTSRAYPLSPQDIQVICRFLDSRPSVPLAIKSCILLAYSSFLRASNLTSPTMSVWGGPHTLKASDIIQASDGLYIMVRSTKTLSGAKPTCIYISPVSDPAVCPVLAWKRYKAVTQSWPHGPAFLDRDSLLLTPRPIVALMRLALGTVGNLNANQVSMHYLRRGGVQCAANHGATREQLMTHGTWKSASGLQPYIDPEQRIIPQVIAKSLAQ